MKSVKKFLLGNPAKKEKVALKPKHALNQAAPKRLNFSDIVVVPPTSRLLLVALCVLLGLTLWLLPSSLGFGRFSQPALAASLAAKIEAAGLDDGFKSHLRRGGEPDELASLYGALAVGLRHDQYKIAQQRLAQRETLWEVAAACAQLQLKSDAHNRECRERLDKFLVTKTKKEETHAYFSDPSREPQLRAVLLAARVYEEAGGKLPEGLGAWVLAIQNDDGGWPSVPGLPSSLVETWRGIQLLQRLNLMDSETKLAAVRFVQSCQAVDGGFSQRPQSLLERAQRHAASFTIPSIRGTHALLLLGQNAGTAIRYVFSLNLVSVSSLYDTRNMIEEIKGDLPIAVSSPAMASWFRSAGLLLAFLVAPLLFANIDPPGEELLLAGCCVAAGVFFESQWGALAVACVVIALFLALHLVFMRIPFNDTGEELLYVSLASAAGSAGLFFALGYSGPDVWTRTASLYVFLIWGPLCSYLAVYVACMFMVRANTYFVASTFAAWLIVLALIPFLLYRQRMLDTVIRLLLVRGHFGPVVGACSAVSLFANHAVALIANSK